MENFSLDDNRTIQAIGILADALDGVTDGSAVETVMVSKALRQVIATRSQPAFEFATKAFNTLDPALRRRVAEDADHAAHDAVELRVRVGGFLSTAPRKPQSAQGQPTSFLTALNMRKRRPGA